MPIRLSETQMKIIRQEADTQASLLPRPASRIDEYADTWSVAIVDDVFNTDGEMNDTLRFHLQDNVKTAILGVYAWEYCISCCN